MEIRISKISKFDKKKADEKITELAEAQADIVKKLKNMVSYAIKHFEGLRKKFGGDEMARKTSFGELGAVEKRAVAQSNVKLYADFKEGFVGYGNSMKKETLIEECSDISDVICFFKDGTMKIVRVDDKVFVGKGLLYAAVWLKGDKKTTYSLIYQTKDSEESYAKRFVVDAITRDKIYPLTQNEGDKVFYFNASRSPEKTPNVIVKHAEKKGLKKKEFEFELTSLIVKGRSSQGNRLSKNALASVKEIERS